MKDCAGAIEAAVNEGVACIDVSQFSIDDYRESLEARLSLRYSVMRGVINQVKHSGKRIVFPEGEHEKVIQAASELVDEGICFPILLGNPPTVKRVMEELGVDFPCEIINPRNDKRRPGK